MFNEFNDTHLVVGSSSLHLYGELGSLYMVLFSMNMGLQFQSCCLRSSQTHKHTLNLDWVSGRCWFSYNPTYGSLGFTKLSLSLRPMGSYPMRVYISYMRITSYLLLSKWVFGLLYTYYLFIFILFIFLTYDTFIYFIYYMFIYYIFALLYHLWFFF